MGTALGVSNAPCCGIFGAKEEELEVSATLHRNTDETIAKDENIETTSNNEIKDSEREPLTPQNNEPAAIEEKEVGIDIDIIYKKEKTVTFKEKDDGNEESKLNEIDSTNQQSVPLSRQLSDSLSSSSFGSHADHRYGDTDIETPDNDNDLPPDYDPPINYQYSASTTHIETRNRMLTV